jgi:transposase
MTMSRPKNHCVKLNEQQRQYLQKIVETGKDKTRKITRCRILLLADEAKGKTDEEISDALNVCLATIFNIRRKYHHDGLEGAINERSPSGSLSSLKVKTEQKLRHWHAASRQRVEVNGVYVYCRIVS